MARKPRVEFDGALYHIIYHIIVRGNQRQKIFRDDRDRITYLERLEKYRGSVLGPSVVWYDGERAKASVTTRSGCQSE
jgi:hypothetical protein